MLPARCLSVSTLVPTKCPSVGPILLRGGRLPNWHSLSLASVPVCCASLRLPSDSAPKWRVFEIPAWGSYSSSWRPSAPRMVSPHPLAGFVLKTISEKSRPEAPLRCFVDHLGSPRLGTPVLRRHA